MKTRSQNLKAEKLRAEKGDAKTISASERPDGRTRGLTSSGKLGARVTRPSAGGKTGSRTCHPKNHFSVPNFSAIKLCVFLFLLLIRPVGAEPPKNLFANPSFELGHEGWRLDKAGKTVAQFALAEQDAAEGQRSARVTVGAIDDWGVQFGQSFAAGEKGRTYTFAVFAKSAKAPVEVGLQIERSANPWDRAVSRKFTLNREWQELHVTFTVEKDFHEGWFAYLSCTQPNVQFQADMFRLYEGPYEPYEQIAEPAEAAVAVRLFDTGRTADGPLAGAAIAKHAGWIEVSEDDTSHTFQGDAVLMNNRIALVLRRGAPGAEVYSRQPGAPVKRAVLAPGGEGNPVTLSSFNIVECNQGAGSADALFKTSDGKQLTLRYELKLGQPFLQTEARDGAKSLRVEAPCRFLVMPDFFADDIVIDAAVLPAAKAELPSDNFLLHLLPDHQAIVMTVVKISEEDVRVDLSGEGQQRTLDCSELAYGKDGKIWVGLMTGPDVWHEQDVTREQAGQIVRLDWKAPFPAQWRVDWRRDADVTDSWEMLNERPDGSFTKRTAFGGADTIPADRRRWTTVLGTFKYPCWLDLNGQAFLQPLKTSVLRFEGPAVIYPMNRVSATALDTFTVLDLVRNTLGVGPCEYVLDLEGQHSTYKGRATCSVRDTLNPIYAAKQQVQRQAEIEKVLQDLMIFIRHIRGRIEGYVEFGHQTLAYLAEQKKLHPELGERLTELENLAHRIDDRFAARREKIKTPEHVAEMVADFRKTVLNDQGDDALARCRQFTEGWVQIGGNQDELVGECRWAVKMIRQKAGLLMAVDPRLAEVAKEIRQRSQVVLRNPAGHEGARH